MMDLGLQGKVAIITGGSDGLGRASAERLAAEGVKVAIAARRPDHLARAAEEIRAADIEGRRRPAADAVDLHVPGRRTDERK